VMNKREFLIQWCFLKSQQSFSTTDIMNAALPAAAALWDRLEEYAPEDTIDDIEPLYKVNIKTHPPYVRPYIPYGTNTDGGVGTLTTAVVGAAVLGGLDDD
jgi:hypothetical protein